MHKNVDFELILIYYIHRLNSKRLCSGEPASILVFIFIYRKCFKVKFGKLEELKMRLSMRLSGFSLRGNTERKIIIVLILALISAPILTYHIGSSKNLSHALVEEKLSADEEYNNVISGIEEQSGKLDELKEQISESEAKLEEYRIQKENSEKELAELDRKLTEKHEILYPSAKSEVKVALSDNSTVYVTKTGKKYHRDGCSSLSKSKIPITYAEAVAKGYMPCKSCN